MTDVWQGVLADTAARSGVASHRDGLMRLDGGGAIIAPLTHLAEIRCTGSDAAAFLHNQLTSDVTHLKSGNGQFSSWCSAKGRMLASFVVARPAQDFSLLAAQDLADTLIKRLRMFVLRAKVVVEDGRPDSVIAGVAGTQAAGAFAKVGLPAPSEPMQTAVFDGGWVMRLHDDRFLIRLDAGAAQAWWTRLTAEILPVPGSVWRWLDVSSGLPWITAATSEEFVPQMVGFDRLGGVSFHKGCYPGQEVVARTQYLGKVKRHLYKAQGTSAVTPGTQLFASDDPAHPCGIVVESSAGPSGRNDLLAVLQESAAAGIVRVGSISGEELAQLTPVDL